METITLQKDAPPQMDNSLIVDNDQRLVKIWGSVEVNDSQGEKLPIHPYFDRIMPMIMDRGGVITYGPDNMHTDIVVGKALNYGFGMHPELGEEGVWLLVKVHNSYPTDDEAWEQLKKGELMLSFSGKGYKSFQMSELEPEKVVNVFEGYSFALVPRGANPGANIIEVNRMAKSDSEEHRCKECGRDHKIKSDDGGIIMIEAPNDREAERMARELPAVRQGKWKISQVIRPSPGSNRYYIEYETVTFRKSEESVKTETDVKLISENSLNVINNMHGGNSMEAATDATINYVTRSDFEAFQKSMTDSMSAISKSIEQLVKSVAARKAEDEDDKKEHEMEMEKKKADSYEENLKPLDDKKVGKAEVSTPQIEAEVVKVLKSMGYVSTTPRPAAGPTPDPERVAKSEKIDYLKIAKDNSWEKIKDASVNGFKSGRTMEEFLNGGY